MPPPITPAPSTPIVVISLTARSFEVGEVDARQPEAGRGQLVRRGEPLRRLEEPVEPGHARPLDDARAELVAALVVLAVELDAEHPLDEATGLAPLDVVAAERLGDAGRVGQELRRDLVGHEIGVALEHHRELLVALEDRALLVVPQRAEEHLGPLRHPRHRLGVGRVEVAERVLERVRVERERADVVAGDLHQPLAHPRAASAARRAPSR